MKNIKDFLLAFQTAEAQSKELPRYVAYGQMALPPLSGFYIVTEALSSLRSNLGVIKNNMNSFTRLKEEMQVMRQDMQAMKSVSERRYAEAVNSAPIVTVPSHRPPTGNGLTIRAQSTANHFASGPRTGRREQRPDDPPNTKDLKDPT